MHRRHFRYGIMRQLRNCERSKHALDTSKKHLICHKWYESVSWLHTRLHLLRQPFGMLSNGTRFRRCGSEGKRSTVVRGRFAEKAAALHDRNRCHERSVFTLRRTAGADTAMPGVDCKIWIWCNDIDEIRSHFKRSGSAAKDSAECKVCGADDVDHVERNALSHSGTPCLHHQTAV